MDNITHSIIGLGVAELLQRSLAPEAQRAAQRGRHRLMLFSCWFASNMPDLDLFLTPLLPKPLGYLLEHRGHTHTLLWALPQALLLLAALWLFWPGARALLKGSAAARAGLGAALLLGLGLHLSMDFLNSYGLHPFYPFDPRWFYGDLVFIVEPLFWVALGAPLALMLARPVARGAALAALAGALLFFAARGFLGWGACAVLLGLGAGLALLQRRAGERGRGALLAGLAVCLGFIAVQGGAAALARQRIDAALQRIDPAARLLDVALTAYPSQPLCWSFVTLEMDEARDRYRLRRGVASLAPDALAPAACPAGLTGALPRRALAPGIAADLELDGSLAALRALRRDDCHVAAWLRFARAPVVEAGKVYDLRYSSLMKDNFSTLDLARARLQGCPASVPAWDFPRRDLLTAPSG